MHFWIDKRSSQLHQYGGGRRGAGGFYSQNFGTHRGTHHPPPSLAHHHPHRIRSRSSSTNNAIPTGGGNNPTNNINNNNTHQSPSSNATSSTSTSTTNGNNSVNIALQYPHQQPHHGQQQHAHLNHTSSRNVELGNSGNVSAIAGTIGRFPGRSSEGYRNGNTLLSQAAQQQPILGGGILAITGSSSNAAAAAMNTPMAIVSGDDGESGGMSATTVLTFPPSSTGVNRSNSINVQLISCVNINPENRGGIDLSWRNPYHVPGSSISRCRAYSREIPPSLVRGSSATSSRSTRGQRTSSSSSSAFGRNSLGTIPATTVGASSNHSQNVTNETPDVMTDRSTRSQRTLFDRDTATPQGSLSLTSPETGGEQSSRGTSTGGRPSLENDPGWACTKRVGLTLCFLAFILLGTVGAKFMIQGPGVIDTGKAEAAAYFLFTELIFVAFAMALFFTGVACLRKRTNDYLLRQFNQYIMNTSPTPTVPGGTMGGIPGQDAYDFEYYDGAHPPINSGSPSSRGHHHHLHHNLHHGGFHHYRSSGSLLEEGDIGSGDLSQSPHNNFNGAGPIHYPAHYGSGSNGSNRHGRSKPPPYHIALYLPLPEMGGGGNSPTEENDTTNNNANHERSKSSNGKSSDSIGFIDSSSVKDAQDGGNNVNYSGINNSSENRDSNSRNEDDTNGQENRSETPPPPYEQL